MALLQLGGCGSDGVPVDNGGNWDKVLIATWQPVGATDNSEPASVAEFLEWEPGITACTLRFENRGAAQMKYFSGAQQMQTDDGTWEAEWPNGEVTFDSNTTQFSYTVMGNVLRMTINEDGHVIILTWARTVDINLRDPAMQRTWRIDGVSVNDQQVPVSEFFETQPGSDGYVTQFLPGGQGRALELDGAGEVDEEGFTWAADNGVLVIDYGDGPVRSVYDLGPQVLMFVDGEGNAVRFSLSRWAPLEQHNLMLRGVWQAVAVTEDGDPIALSEYYGWDPGVTSTRLELWADGTVESRDHIQAAVHSAALGWWGTDGATLKLWFGDLELTTYAVVGNTFAISHQALLHTYVVTFVRMS